MMRLSSTVKNGMLLLTYIATTVVLSLWLAQYTGQGDQSTGGLNFLGTYTWVLPLAALVVIGGSFLLALRFIGRYFVLMSFVELITRSGVAALTCMNLDNLTFVASMLRGVNIFTGVAASVLFFVWLLRPRLKNTQDA